MDYNTRKKMTSPKKVEPPKEDERVVLLKNQINHLENEIKNLKKSLKIFVTMTGSMTK
jgi:hypothetical protein